MASERSRVSDLAAWVGAQLKAATWTTRVLAADVSTNAVAATDVTGLGVLLPSGLYEVRAGLLISTAAVTTGPQVGFAWPAGVTYLAGRVDTPSAAAATVMGMVRASGDKAANTGLPVINTPYLALAYATVRVVNTLSSPGLRPTLASEVAGSAVTMKADSWLSYRRLGA